MTRTSRIASGLVLITGAVVLAAYAIRLHPLGDGLYGEHNGSPSWHTPHVIGATWAAAFIAAILGSFVPDRGEQRHVASYVLPSVGAALMLPLTLHLPFAGAMHVTNNGFDTWVELSLILVGVAHVVFAVMVGRRAAALAEGREPTSVRSIYLTTVLCGGIPGVIIVVPVVLVAMTVAFFVPLLYGMERWIRPMSSVPVAIARAV